MPRPVSVPDGSSLQTAIPLKVYDADKDDSASHLILFDLPEPTFALFLRRDEDDVDDVLVLSVSLQRYLWVGFPSLPRRWLHKKG